MITTTPEAMLAWGRHTHGSPLYHHLVEVIATDPELMRVMGRIGHLPQANLVFGAVHFLMMTGEGPELAAYYPSLVEGPLPLEGVGPVFRDFVLDHEEEIVEIGNTRYTQTNECRRCVALLPLVMMSPFDRFHLIDVGTSAGLNLGIDRFHYHLGGQVWGPGSTVVLTAESRGATPRLRDIEVQRRIGLDLDPIDPGDGDSRLWLDALIWPEHTERRARLRAALALVETLDLEMVAGDALLTLPDVLADIPKGEPIVVANSFTLIQFSAEQRDRLDAITQASRSRRPVFRVSMEAIDKRDDWARLVVDDGSGPVTVGQA
ncbi:MAG: DUF2332 domain-containing protein, partial [Acidimicrobiia bacterium]